MHSRLLTVLAANRKPVFFQDFSANSEIDPRITFTRSTPGTYIDADGVMRSAAINTPRFQSQGGSRGLLIEQQRTNYLLRSQEFDNASWTKDGSSITANAIAAPDGTTTADLLVEAATTATHGFNQIAAGNSTIVTALSLYVKPKERSICRIDSTDGGVNFIRAYFDLSGAGSVSNITNNGTASQGAANITQLANGWYRIEVSGQPASANSGFIRLTFRMETAIGGTGYTGDGSSGMYVWGAQLEPWSGGGIVPMFASSYIATTSSMVTRTADSALITGSNFTSIFDAALQGTMFAEAITPNTTFGTDYGLFSLSDNTANNCVQLKRVASTGLPSANVTTGGAQQAGINPTPPAAWGTGKGRLALRFKANDFAAAFNGGTVSTDTAGTVPTVTQAEIGYGTGIGYTQGIITQLGFWPIILNDTQLQAITK